ncbi:hypothetical protein [Acidisoma sp. 7E03]
MMRDPADTSSRPEQLALWAIRRLRQRRPSPFAQTPGRETAWGRGDFEAPLRCLRHADAMVRAQRGAGLDLANPGHLGITTEERILVRATSAAQASDASRVAMELSRLDAHHAARDCISDAVTLLGAVLAAAGHWLPPPWPEAHPSPAPFLDHPSQQERHAHGFRNSGQSL